MSELDSYDYELPHELIAQHPLANRIDARLLVVRRKTGDCEHFHVRDLPELLGPRDLLVLNDTKVIPARLVGKRTRTGGRWRGLFLRADETGLWQVLGKTRGRLEVGETVMLQDRDGREVFRLTMLAKLDGGVWAARPDLPGTPWELLDRVGRVPLPPYIRDGEMVDDDERSYQTVFAQTPGAVAAPTAGLHFTPELLQQLEKKGVGNCRVTLHVGIGTFRPVTATRLSEHSMHFEWCAVSSEVAMRINAHRAAGGRIVAVGTTVVRTLETAASSGTLQPWAGETNLFIRPPYAFRVVNVLLTNFHLPKSTLLILVRTFGGDALLKRAYQAAIEERYRFFSYGDAMLIE